MRLLLLDQFNDLGGAQQCLLDLVPAFLGRAWDITAGLPGDGVLSTRLRDAGIAVERIACGPYACGRKTAGDGTRFLRDTPTLARQIRALARNADLVYVNGPRLLPAAALAGIRGPAVFHAHSLAPGGIPGRLARAALDRLAASVIANCRFVAASWRPRSSRLSIVYNGVAPRPAPQTRDGRTVACIGRIAPEKGAHYFVEAARQIRREEAGCRFVLHGASLFGSGDYERVLRSQAATLPLEFAGWRDDVAPALASTDVLLVPSSPAEATTRVVLEAFSAGAPVVAFAHGGLPEVIDHGRTGFLARSVEEMSAFAVALLRDPKLRTRISAAAYQSWRERFTLERFRRDVVAEVETALLPALRPQPLRPAWDRSRTV